MNTNIEVPVSVVEKNNEEEKIEKIHLPHCELSKLKEEQKRYEEEINKRKRKANLISSSLNEYHFNSNGISNGNIQNQCIESQQQQKQEQGKEEEEEEEKYEYGTKVKIKKNKKRKHRYHYDIVCGAKSFATLREAQEYCKSILKSEYKEFSPTICSDVFQVLKDMFQRCPTFKQMNIQFIGIRKPEKDTKCASFYFKTDRGQIIPVNYRDCLKLNPPSIDIQPTYKIAFQTAVRPFLNKKKKEFVKMNHQKLSSTGFSFNKKNCEIIYKNKTFDEILQTFLNEKKLREEDLNAHISNNLKNLNKAAIINPGLKMNGYLIIMKKLN